jgi:hypothetical protein
MIPDRYHWDFPREPPITQVSGLRGVTTETGRGILLRARPTQPQIVTEKQETIYWQQGKPLTP